MAIDMFMTVYAFSIDKYRMYVEVSGYVLVMFYSIGYGLFKYFPIIRSSKRLSASGQSACADWQVRLVMREASGLCKPTESAQRVPQKAISEYVR